MRVIAGGLVHSEAPLGSPSAFTPFVDTALPAGQASLLIPAVPQNGAALLFVLTGNTISGSGAACLVAARFNLDATVGHYIIAGLTMHAAAGGTFAPHFQVDSDSFAVVGNFPRNLNLNNRGSIAVLLPGYAYNDAFQQVVSWDSGNGGAGGGNDYWCDDYRTTWRQAAAINEVEFFIPAGFKFSNKCRVTGYLLGKI